MLLTTNITAVPDLNASNLKNKINYDHLAKYTGYKNMDESNTKLIPNITAGPVAHLQNVMKVNALL